MDYQYIRVETRHFDSEALGWALITINRPDALNALSRDDHAIKLNRQRPMVGRDDEVDDFFEGSFRPDELHHATREIELEEVVRAVAITGAGKAFVAGADISEMASLSPRGAMEFAEKGAQLGAAMEASEIPYIAAVNGFALGGGCELAMACDFRVAGASSRFGQPEVGLGIMAAAGGTRRLPALVGIAQARRLLFSGAIVAAEEALGIGLVDRVVPDDAVPGAVDELLAPILKQAPEAVRRTKAALLAWVHGAGEADLRRLDDATQAELFEHPDKFARMDAFLARRSRPKQG